MPIIYYIRGKVFRARPSQNKLSFSEVYYSNITYALTKSIRSRKIAWILRENTDKWFLNIEFII